jgi:threonine dehydratase
MAEDLEGAVTGAARRRPTTRTPDRAQRRAAEAIVARHLAVTPLVEFAGSHAGLLLKVETVQPTGSFKVRGALAALAAAPPDRPVVAASAGNHALGIAHAAALLGRKATVVVPTPASAAKVQRLARCDVRLVQHGDGYDAAEAHGLQLAADDDARFVSAYDDADVIAGQRTVGVEIGRQLAGPMTIVCPVGGGGLLAGVALWASEQPDVRVVGVEAAASRALSAAVRAGAVADVPIGPTLADGMAGGLEPGAVTVEIARRYAHDLVAVDELALGDAIRALAFEQGIVVEGAGAAGAAAVLRGQVVDERPGARIVAVLTGRNITPAALLAVLGARKG